MYSGGRYETCFRRVSRVHHPSFSHAARGPCQECLHRDICNRGPGDFGAKRAFPSIHRHFGSVRRAYSVRGDYHDPKKGYLYFRVPPEKEEAIRKDWEQLKGFAGTGEVVAFGEYWVPSPIDPQGNPHHSLQVTIHTADDLSSPDDYPLYRDPVGVRRGSEMTCDANHDPKCHKIMAQLRAAWHH